MDELQENSLNKDKNLAEELKKIKNTPSSQKRRTIRTKGKIKDAEIQSQEKSRGFE